jgi:hypothetical protein
VYFFTIVFTIVSSVVIVAGMRRLFLVSTRMASSSAKPPGVEDNDNDAEEREKEKDRIHW